MIIFVWSWRLVCMICTYIGRQFINFLNFLHSTSAWRKLEIHLDLMMTLNYFSIPITLVNNSVYIWQVFCLYFDLHNANFNLHLVQRFLAWFFLPYQCNMKKGHVILRKRLVCNMQHWPSIGLLCRSKCVSREFQCVESKVLPKTHYTVSLFDS